jgi:hypothetical protein
MANIDTTSFINFDELTNAQRLLLKARLRERKKLLNAATVAVNRALRNLAKRPKRKKTAKRKYRRRKR